MRLWPSLLLLLLACATIDTSKLNDGCRGLYDACLNNCERVHARSRVRWEAADAPSQDLQVDVASCTHDCNTRARQCE
jgi:hypothetical protein